MSMREKRGVCKLIFEIYVILFWQWGKPSMHTRIESQNQSVFANGFPLLSLYVSTHALLHSSSEQHSTLMFVSLYAFMHIQRLVPGFLRSHHINLPEKPNINNNNCRRFSTPVCSLFHVVPISTNDTGESHTESSRILCYFRCCSRWRWLWCLFFFFFSHSFILYVFFSFDGTRNEEKRDEKIYKTKNSN